jgi:hypothetical protein
MTEKSEHSLPIELREVLIEHVTDPTAMGDTMTVVTHDVINLDSEAINVKRVMVPLAECFLVHAQTTTALRTLTNVHEDFEGCFILGPNARGNIDGMELQPNDLMLAATGVQKELIVDRDYQHIACFIPHQALNNHLGSRGNIRDFVPPEGIWQEWQKSYTPQAARYAVQRRNFRRAGQACQICGRWQQRPPLVYHEGYRAGFDVRS